MSTSEHDSPLQNLPSFSKKEVKASNAFASFLDALKSETLFVEGFEKDLTEFLGQPFQVGKIQSTVSKLDTLTSKNEANSLISSLKSPALDVTIFLETSFSLVKTIASTLLGLNTTATLSSSKTPTQVEIGIFEAFLLKLLSSLKKLFSGHPEMQLELSNLAPGSVSEFFNSEQPSCFQIGLSFTINGESFRVAVWCPLSFAISLNSDGRSKGAFSFQELLNRCANVETPLSIRAGNVGLSESEIENLEVDDIIVLEGFQLTLQDSALLGPIQCPLGKKPFGSIEGNLILTDKGHYALSIDNILPSIEPKSSS